MAKNLKGITVEIGGDTAPLSKALDGVNKTSRSLQIELRQVEKLLKLDPTNTELLAQKQELLGKSINSTEEKLNALKAAQAQVQAQFEKGDIGEEQYREFQRELIKTEQELNNIKGSYQVATRNLEEFGDNNGVAKEEAEKLSRAVEEQNRALAAEKEALKQAEQEQKEHAEAVKKATEELEKQKDELVNSAKVIGAGILAVGTATSAGAGYALKFSSEFDKALNTIITRTGASKDEFDSLNQAMENIYKNNLGESIEDVAQSMSTVKLNTNLAGNELEKATKNAILLRDTFEFEVNESTRAAKMLMEQFGLSSDEAYNLIAQGAQMGLDKNGDLLDTINEYSVHFEQAGYSAEEMFNSLKNGTDAGTFSVDKLGDAVKEFGIRMKDGSASDSIKELGLNVDDVTKRFAQGGEIGADAMGEIIDALFSVKDPLKQNEIGVAMFGTMWEDLGPKGIKALMNINGEANRTSNTLESINNQKYDDIGFSLAELGRTLNTDVIKPLGEELQPVVEEAISYVKDNAPTIKDILSDIADVIGDIVSFIVNKGPTIAGILGGLAASFMILKGVLVAEKIFNFAKGLKELEGGLKLANVATKLFNSTWLANPMVLIGAAIAGVVAGLIVFWNTNEDFRNNVLSAWESIKQSASDCWGSICNFFTETIPNAWNVCITFLQGIPDWFGNLWTMTMDTFTQWGNNVSIFFTQTIPQWIDSIFNWFNELPYKIGFALGSALAKIINWGVNSWNYLVTNVPIWINNVSNWFSQLPGKIWTWLSNSIQNIVNWGTQTYNNAKNAASNTINSIVSYFSQLPGRIWTWLSNAISKIVQMGTSMVSKGRTAASNTVTSIVNGFTSLPGKLVNIGKSAVEGIWRGITGSANWLKNKISGFSSGIVDGFKSALKINSPSKIMRDTIGVGIVEGIDVGIDKEMPNLNKGIKGNMNNMLSNMKSIIDFTTPSIPTGLINSLSQSIKPPSTTANSTNSDVLSKILNKLESLDPKIYLNDHELVNSTVNLFDKSNGERAILSERGLNV